MRTLLSLFACSGFLGAQDIASRDQERDPLLSELLADPAMTNSDPLSWDESAAETPAPALEPPDEAMTPEPSGVEVMVSGGTGQRPVDPTEVKLLAPFPAKPLSAAPAGWQIVQPDDVPAFSKEVTLANGTTIDLAVRPHVLVPKADGSQVFALAEPGFDPTLGYAQDATVGAVLADAIRELDQTSKRLDQASGRLSELLNSLPAAPEPEEIDAGETPPDPTASTAPSTQPEKP
jgi:hypothetical protein